MRLVMLLVPSLAALCWGQPKAVSVDIDSVIHPITAEIVAHAVTQAQSDGAQVVLLRLNTPGGLLEATREILERIAASPVPVVTFVTPTGGRAASAGFFLLLAGDVAAMSAGTHAGAASPVTLGQPLDPVMRKKVESDASAAIRSLAVRHNRDGALAEKAVLEAKAFTSEEALAAKLVDLVVRDEAELWSRLDGREITRGDGARVTLHTHGIVVEPYRLSLRERAVAPLADPNLAFLILVLGGLLLYVEFTQPGMVLPGAAGAILALIGLMALSVLPISATAAALLGLSVVLFVLEAKLATHGALAVGGAAAMVLGAVLLVEGPPVLRIRLSVALAVALPFAAITVALVSLVVRARLRPPQTGAPALLGRTAQVHEALAPRGKVYFDGQFWDAVSDRPVAQGSLVRILSVDGLLLKVEAAGGGAKEVSS